MRPVKYKLFVVRDTPGRWKSYELKEIESPRPDSYDAIERLNEWLAAHDDIEIINIQTDSANNQELGESWAHAKLYYR